MTKAVSKPRRNAKQVAKPETRQEPDEFDNMATERAMKRLKGVRGRYRVDPQPGDIVRSPHKDETGNALARSEEHTSELQSLMRISYADFCLTTKTTTLYHSPTVRHTTRSTI